MEVIEVLAVSQEERGKIESTRERVKNIMEVIDDLYKLEIIEIFVESIKD